MSIASTLCLAVPAMALAGWTARWLMLPPQDRGLFGFRGVVAWWVERRLGGYRHRFHEPASSLSDTVSKPLRVAVIGGGIAGIGAASVLGERGADVVLYERNNHIGGKLGAWTHTFEDGSQEVVEHGFHAFFRHYYNWNAFLDTMKLREGMRAIADYFVLKPDGTSTGFRNVDTVPMLNLYGLWRAGAYKMRDVLFTPARDYMHIFLRYDGDATFEEYDNTSYAAFAKEAHLPKDLQVVFNNFARAFFADTDKMSFAEMLKSFHSYYLSHDHGLLYDFPTVDWEEALLAPIREHLTDLGVQIRLEHPVHVIERDGDAFRVDGERYDSVVMACDMPAARMLLSDREWLDEDTRHKLKSLPQGQRYAVLRFWSDRDVRGGIPPYFVTDRAFMLDAVALYHRMEEGAVAYQKANGGGVYELHCYAVPDELPDEDVRDRLLAEFEQFFPEMSGQIVSREILQIKDDFVALHTGAYANRPSVQTATPGLFLAGDWVRVPFPAMLMEAAYSTGVLAANAILEPHGTKGRALDTVPLVGLFAASR